MTLADVRIVPELQSCMAKSRLSPIGVTGSEAAANIINEQVGGKLRSKLITDLASSAGNRQDVVSTVAHELIGFIELMAPVARFVAETVGKNR